MAFLSALWLPIVVCAVAVFVCSFICWALSPHHKGDWKKLPDEDGIRRALKAFNLTPGVYLFPMMEGKECNSPEGKAKWDEAPAGELRVWTRPNMPVNMLLTFAVFLVATVLIGYVSWKSVEPTDATFSAKFQIIGTIGVLTYCFSFLPNYIWFQGGARAAINCVLDGVVYGLVTGAVFAWLWPVGTAAV